MDTKQQSNTKLQATFRASFDREYVNFEIKDHREDIALFQREVSHGTNPDVKAWASQNLPALQEHLRIGAKRAKPDKLSP